MTVTLSELDFSAIPPAERIMIAQVLLDSVLFANASSALTPAQLAEMHARIEDIDAGRVTCLPWKEVRERLWNRV